jgi:hypothetical protein
MAGIPSAMVIVRHKGRTAFWSRATHPPTEKSRPSTRAPNRIAGAPSELGMVAAPPQQRAGRGEAGPGRADPSGPPHEADLPFALSVLAVANRSVVHPESSHRAQRRSRSSIQWRKIRLLYYVVSLQLGQQRSRAYSSRPFVEVFLLCRKLWGEFILTAAHPYKAQLQ